jgi:hypothetical protein
VAAEWLPFGVQHELIFASEGHPVKDIPLERMIQVVKSFAQARD